VVLGLTLVNTVQPGTGVPAEARAALTADAASRASGLASAHAPASGWSLLIGIVPDNAVKAAANGDMLAVMFFALMIGVGLTLTRTDAARHFEETVEGLYDVTMRLIAVVIGLAPVGVAALLFTLTAQIGYGVLLLLARYTLLVIGALALHQFVVYALAAWRPAASSAASRRRC
jgi:DAACS family dicarboxylate/amino acid:cation (Na+ or H+) symporter